MVPELHKEKIRLIAFDIDGTIFSSEDIILDTYREAFLEFKEETGSNLELPSQEALMAEIGKPVKTIFKNLLPELSESNRDIISGKVLDILCRKIKNGEGHPYPDIKVVIEELYKKKFFIAAASNGRYPYIETILNVLDIFSLFHQVIVLDYKERLVKADLLAYYKKIYQLKSEEILMVGDRFSDWEAADRENTPFLYCNYGHAIKGEIPNFSHEISSFKKILEIF
ncbi:MAG: HAD family hydrolase [Leptospiraceae bacterium]|nr:HAD family hydrolase [Leptospiraceae bacterium]